MKERICPILSVHLVVAENGLCCESVCGGLQSLYIDFLHTGNILQKPSNLFVQADRFLFSQGEASKGCCLFKFPSVHGALYTQSTMFLSSGAIPFCPEKWKNIRKKLIFMQNQRGRKRIFLARYRKLSIGWVNIILGPEKRITWRISSLFSLP